MVEFSPIRALVHSFLFTNAFGWLMDMAGYISFVAIDTTIFFATASGSLFFSIALANTPLAKGVSLGIFALSMVAFMTSIAIPDPTIQPFVYTFLTLPSILTLGGSLLELGKG